ncbi:Hint domain-containing protein [Psychromarinibacter sp. C21-152]|uniref:Hint domain-containing protein n=1 Tax=Psychromarinibacter sediminicola TaxID=3033385 RepID=A0AAE3NWN8_9RHOB|nr:Hint domain-containing protein [Psychromarinibacter sediminicola]MDF0603391.1 Hint domain-containing protein [Psychromarinibacter sediminicola]
MAVLDVDLGSSDQTIDSSNYSSGDTVNITALGSHALTIDGVDVELSSIVGLQAGATPTFETINGGSLAIDQGLLDASLLSGVTYSMHDTSSIAVDSSSVTALTDLLSTVDLDFNGDADADFSYTPAAIGTLSPITFNVFGMESFDQLVIAGRTDLSFSYDTGTQTATVSSTSALGQDVRYVVQGMTQEQADLVLADIADTAADTWIDGDAFTFPVCLTSEAQVLTPFGERRCGDLEVGDLVITSDRGAQPIRWIGRMTFTARDMDDRPRNRPVRIGAGALGNGVPGADLLVSPQHRILVHSRVAERMFGTRDVLVPARKLLDMPGIEVAVLDHDITYMNLMFDNHEVIFAEHAPVESLLTGPMTIRAMPAEQIVELADIYPELFEPGFETESARLIPKGRRIATLVARHMKNRLHPLTC